MPDPKSYILNGGICIRFWKGKAIETENQSRGGVKGKRLTTERNRGI